MMRLAPVLVLFVASAALAACDQMARQKRYDGYGAAALFSDGKVVQAPPAGTVSQGAPARIAALAEAPPMTMALLQRGRERYSIFCEPCHDASGYGQGVVPSRGFPHPPSFHSPRLRQAPSRHIVDVITNGYGVMYAYVDRVPPADRWAIAAYIRSLQLSQATPVAALTAAERARLEASHGG